MPARVRLALMVFASLAILTAAGVIIFTRPDSPPKLGANGFAGGLRPAIPPKDFSLRDQTLTATVEETGGFQQFVPKVVGTLNIAQPGRYTLAVKPRSKPGPAVMDLRQVRLVPAPTASKP